MKVLPSDSPSRYFTRAPIEFFSATTKKLDSSTRGRECQSSLGLIFKAVVVLRKEMKQHTREGKKLPASSTNSGLA